MKCTECSTTVKPVVAIDIDGTLADYHTHFLNFAEAYTGLVVKYDYDGRRSFRDWYLDLTGLPEADWYAIKLAYRQGGQKRSAPTYPDAWNLCTMVQEEGAELWLTTTRPYLRLDGIDPDTREWLSRNHIEYDGLLYDKFKYQRLAERIDRARVVAVLDDLAEMFSAAASAFGWKVPILRRTKWNRAVACDQEAADLREARLIIEGRIRQWRKDNG